MLRLGAYEGTVGNSLSYRNGKPFSTYDRDNDGVAQNRVVDYSGAWWYYNGYYSNLSSKWSTSGNKTARWHTLSGSDSVSFSEIKIRKAYTV